MTISIAAPFSADIAQDLRAGDSVSLSGFIYTARDSAHLLMRDALLAGRKLPFDIRGQTLFYAGPTPAPPGRPIGSIGPTTSSRMDFATPLLLKAGMRAMIGKGSRSEGVIQAMAQYGAVYFAAIGGAAALMAGCVLSATVIAYPELGTESVSLLHVKDLPIIVAVDCLGNDYYAQGPKQFLNIHN